MSIATKKFQDWPDEDIQGLCNTVKLNWLSIDFTGMSLYGAGSRACGFQRTDGGSDADIVLLVDNKKTSAFYNAGYYKSFTYNNINCAASVYDTTRKWRIMRDGSSYLPLYNFNTREYEWHLDYTEQEHSDFINDWIDFKIAEGLAANTPYDFTLNRNFDDLIVTRRQPF